MGEDIRLKSKAGELGAYLATPKGGAKGGVVVIQEIFGVNHHIRAVTDQFAADGYLALAPRFFSSSIAASTSCTGLSRPSSVTYLRPSAMVSGV